METAVEHGKLPRPFLELENCFTDLSHLAAAESAHQVVAASTFRAVAHLLRNSSEETEAQEVEEVENVADVRPQRPPGLMVKGVCVQPRAIAAKLRGLRQQLAGDSAEGKAPWIALVQHELEKDACPEAHRPEVIECLRPPKMRLQERRTGAAKEAPASRTQVSGTIATAPLEPSPAQDPREVRSPETDCHWSLDDGSRPMTAACADSEASTRCATAEKATVVATKVEIQLPPVPQGGDGKTGRSKSDSKSMEVPILMLSAIYARQRRPKFRRKLGVP